MHYYSLFSPVFGLASYLGMGLVLFASVIVFRALKDKGAVVLMIGGIVGVFGPVCGFLFRMVGVRLFSVETYGIVRIVMQGVGSVGWLLVGAGMLMLAPVISGMVRRNRELEEILAGRR